MYNGGIIMNFNDLLFLTWVILMAVVGLFTLVLKTHKDELKSDELTSLIKYNMVVKIVMYIAPLIFAAIGVFASILDYEHKDSQLLISLSVTLVFIVLEIIAVKYFHSFTIILRSDYICRRVSLFKDKVIYWKDVKEVKYSNTLKLIKVKDSNGKTISVSTDSMIGVKGLYKAFANSLDSNNPLHREIIKEYSGYV